MDFIKFYVSSAGKNRFECKPDFQLVDSNYEPVKDIMVRNHEFYAFWDKEKGEWSKDLNKFIKAHDREMSAFYEQTKASGLYEGSISALYMKSGRSKLIDDFRHWVEGQMPDNSIDLDTTIVFLDDPHDRELYSSHRLSYNLEDCPTPAFDKLFGTLYDEEELDKIKWAIGSIICGDSKWIQKMYIITGPPGKGKSTVLWLLRDCLFEGYCGKIDADKIGSGHNFAFETVADNPLVALQDEVDLSKLQQNKDLNAFVSHEFVTVNAKNKKQYPKKFHSCVFLCSNKEVNITDSKAGIIRRLIDIQPTGKTLSVLEYSKCKKQIKFELGGIAKKCLDFYLANTGLYDDYIPVKMMRATNVVFTWLEESYLQDADFILEDGITVSRAYQRYREFCENNGIKFMLNRLELQNELYGYFDEFIIDDYVNDKRVKNYFHGFQTEKFARVEKTEKRSQVDTGYWLIFEDQPSLLDEYLRDYPAQYATDEGKPLTNWACVETRLFEIDTKRLHYVNSPEHLIVIDFDLKNEKGEKDFNKNLAEANKWPQTYAELSQSGGGIHLHYIYNGDVNKLANIVSEGIELKVYSGDASLRRRLTKCNNIPIATITSGLPLRKEDKKMLDKIIFQDEKHLMNVIMKQLRKETHADTHQSVSMILKALDDAYSSGMTYCIPTDLREDIRRFCESSSNQSDDCMKMYNQMKFESEGEPDRPSDKPIVFFDIEVYPNKLYLVFKEPNKECVKMLNPSPEEVERWLASFRPIGFNCRKYDNHILWRRALGQSNRGCYLQSKEIVDNSKPDYEKSCFDMLAYGLSYADVYDIATKKQSLKKWEVELGINHKEMELSWDEDVPDELDDEVFSYCCNDVEATEKVWYAIQADVDARLMLSEWSGLPVCSTTNSHTAAIIFDGNERRSRSALKWRDLSKPVPKWENEAVREFLQEDCGRFLEPFDEQSVVPYFPGYKYDKELRKSTYKGFEVGEGGFVYAEPGMYTDVALIDVESMHPNSFIDEVYAGVTYTRRFKDILDLRVMVKHKMYDEAAKFFNGIFAKHLQNKSSAKALAFALKIAINSVYGLTSAKFENPFFNPENEDNIVAKRGALFMIDLLEYVQNLGYTVAHIKTDSIKIPNADNDIIQKVIDFGHKYGYNFVHEATYSKMCLVNDAVYIAKYQTAEWCQDRYNYIPEDNADHPGEWTATGTQFKVPYVFKTLFTHEPIIFDDLCETKSVTTQIYLDMDPDGEHDLHFIGRVGKFTPVHVGGVLLRKQGDKLVAVTGTKGYKWLESLDAIDLPREDIDESYYISLADAAYKAIAKYGDIDWFLES